VRWLVSDGHWCPFWCPIRSVFGAHRPQEQVGLLRHPSEAKAKR
jgi:hypothetical protein